MWIVFKVILILHLVSIAIGMINTERD